MSCLVENFELDSIREKERLCSHVYLASITSVNVCEMDIGLCWAQESTDGWLLEHVETTLGDVSFKTP